MFIQESIDRSYIRESLISGDGGAVKIDSFTASSAVICPGGNGLGSVSVRFGPANECRAENIQYNAAIMATPPTTTTA